MSKLLKLADIISFNPDNYTCCTDCPDDLRTLRHGPALSLVTQHYRAEKRVNDFCCNIKPRPLAIRFRVIVPFGSALQSHLYGLYQWYYAIVNVIYLNVINMFYALGTRCKNSYQNSSINVYCTRPVSETWPHANILYK